MTGIQSALTASIPDLRNEVTCLILILDMVPIIIIIMLVIFLVLYSHPSQSPNVQLKYISLDLQVILMVREAIKKKTE